METYEMYKIHVKTIPELCFLLGQATYGNHRFIIDDFKVTFLDILKDDVDTMLADLEAWRFKLKGYDYLERETIYREVDLEYRTMDIKFCIEDNFEGCFDRPLEEVFKDIDFKYIAERFDGHSEFDWEVLKYTIQEYLELNAEKFGYKQPEE